MITLKDIRLSKRMTQSEAALATGVSLRSYKTYETDKSKQSSNKYSDMMRRLETHVPIDEKNGILTREEIARAVQRVLREYEGEVRYCLLFGSYARERARRDSDVNLLVSTSATGLRLRDMEMRLRDALRKRVSLRERRELVSDSALLDAVLMHGVRIY